MKKIVSFIIIFIYFVHLNANVPACTNPENMNFLFKNKHMINATFDVIQNTGLVSCAFECEIRKKCKSFSFEYVSGKCSLYDTRIQQSLISVKPGTDLSNIQDWPSRFAGPCENHNCSDYEVCHVTRIHTELCLTAYCPEPPVVQHATANFTTTFETTKVGSRLSYVCDTNFKPEGERICLKNGSWSNFRCVPKPCQMHCMPNQAKCFVVCSFKVKWHDARIFCRNLRGKNNSTLADIRTKEEYNFLKGILKIGLIYWIGLNDRQKEGSWVWIDGTNSGFFKWMEDEPNGSTNQNCAYWNIRGEYRSAWCLLKRRFVCRVATMPTADTNDNSG